MNLKRGIIGPALVIAVAVVLIAGGLFGAFYLGKKSSGPTAINPVVTQTQASPIPSPTTDLTANWQTYKADIFEVKYPLNWYLNKADPKSIYPTTDRLRNYDINVYTEAITKQKKNTPDGFSNLFGVDFATHPDVIKSKPTNIVLIDYVKANVIDPTSKNFEEITIDGFSAVMVTTKNSTITNLLNFYLETFILRSGQVYVIAGYVEHPIFTQEGITEFQKTYDQILSTFKFAQ